MASLFRSSNSSSSSPFSIILTENEKKQPCRPLTFNTAETSYRKRKSSQLWIDLNLRESIEEGYEERTGVSTELRLSSSVQKNSKHDHKAADKKINSISSTISTLSEIDDKGVSTKLCLFDESWMRSVVAPRDPWKIKKSLKESDVGNLSRLLLPSEIVKSYVLPALQSGEEDEVLGKEGIGIEVWDCDTESEHRLTLKRWGSSKSYVLVGGWTANFVKRRNLKQKDTVGLYWDCSNSRFNFSVLRRDQ